MTITYRTVVVRLPPTPLGLLPERWTIEHQCGRCRQRVTHEQLIVHAQDHDRDQHGSADEQSFQSPETSGTLASVQGRTEDTIGTPGIPKISMTTDHWRR